MPGAAARRISAKDLGALAMPEFCPRCFWIEAHYEVPFQMGFPGIFASIDSFSKNVVHTSFDRGKGVPTWLAPLGDVTGYVRPPTAQKFFLDDAETGVRLTGAPDGILTLRDGSKVIIDYKTARHTKAQDLLFPIYEVQLNGYAWIAEHVGLGPVSGLALVYTEPATQGEAQLFGEALTSKGFRLGFEAALVPVERKPGLLPPLLRRVRALFDAASPPGGRPGCEDCGLLEALLRSKELAP